MWAVLKTTVNTGNQSVILPWTLLFRVSGDKLYGQKFDEGYSALSERCVLGNFSFYGKNDSFHIVWFCVPVSSSITQTLNKGLLYVLYIHYYFNYIVLTITWWYSLVLKCKELR